MSTLTVSNITGSPVVNASVLNASSVNASVINASSVNATSYSTNGSVVLTGNSTATVLSVGGATQLTVNSTAAVFAGTVADATSTIRPVVNATPVSLTSQTAVDFTGIPSWVKRITVIFSGVSTSGSSVIILQLGTSSGFETTGYASTAWDSTNLSATTGIALSGSVASGNIRSGNFMVTALSGTVWVGSGVIIRTDSAVGNYSAGTKTLSGTLDRIRITTVNGTDTFDAGSINILYE